MSRPNGSQGRNKAFLMKRLQDMYGEDFHPIMRMAEMAVKLQAIANEEPDVQNMKASIEAWDRVAPYCAPKLKAIELSTDDQGIKVVKRVERVIVDGDTTNTDS